MSLEYIFYVNDNLHKRPEMDNCCSQGTKNYSKIESSIEVLKAVSEPNRLRVLCTLSKFDICVCDLAKQMGVSHNLISFHLKTLYEVGILNKKRNGNQIFYCINQEWKERIKYFFKFMDIK